MRYQYTPNIPKIISDSPYEVTDAKKVPSTLNASNVISHISFEKLHAMIFLFP